MDRTQRHNPAQEQLSTVPKDDSGKKLNKEQKKELQKIKSSSLKNLSDKDKIIFFTEWENKGINFGNIKQKDKKGQLIAETFSEGEKLAKAKEATQLIKLLDLRQGKNRVNTLEKAILYKVFTSTSGIEYSTTEESALKNAQNAINKAKSELNTNSIENDVVLKILKYISLAGGKFNKNTFLENNESGINSLKVAVDRYLSDHSATRQQPVKAKEKKTSKTIQTEVSIKKAKSKHRSKKSTTEAKKTEEPKKTLNAWVAGKVTNKSKKPAIMMGSNNSTPSIAPKKSTPPDPATLPPVPQYPPASVRQRATQKTNQGTPPPPPPRADIAAAKSSVPPPVPPRLDLPEHERNTPAPQQTTNKPTTPPSSPTPPPPPPPPPPINKGSNIKADGTLANAKLNKTEKSNDANQTSKADARGISPDALKKGAAGLKKADDRVLAEKPKDSQNSITDTLKNAMANRRIHIAQEPEDDDVWD